MTKNQDALTAALERTEQLEAEPIKYGSVCSGVEAATAAWHPLGWEPQWFSEIEKFPSAVLEHHYPNTPNFGDMTQFKEWPNDPIDLLVGGTPCQSFSVAGLRKGLDDPRGNLMLTYLAIAERYQPRWLVWENVPGVLSSNGGRDFGTFLAALGQIGYGFAYRVLDAQYFGVAQRRRRVFVVGYLGDWRRAAAVLFERESLSGNPAPGREAGEKVAPTVTQGATFSRTGNQRVEAESIVAQCLTTRTSSMYDPFMEALPIAFSRNDDGSDATINLAPTMRVAGHAGGTLSIAFGAQSSANQGDSVPPEVTPTLDKSKTPAVTVALRGREGGATAELGGEIATALRASQGGGDKPYVMLPQAVAWSIMPMNSGKDYKARVTDVAQPLMAGGPVGGNQGGDFIQEPAVRRLTPSAAFAQNQAGEVRESDVFNTLNTNSNASGRNTPLLRDSMAVRRLTPIECERLQGFPDNYTQIPWRNKPAEDCPDGPRYKAMSNSMAVPVMRWIGDRIQMVQEMEVE